MECLVNAVTEKAKFWQFLAILRDPAYNHQLLIIVLTELRARELHLKGEFWIVLRKLGCQRYWIEWVWHIFEANFAGREGNLLAGSGSARVKQRRGPSLVPGAGGDEVFIEEASVWILEATDRATGVEDGGVIDQAAVPFPGASSWLLRRISTVDSCR